MSVPEQLTERWSRSTEGRAWLDQLPSWIGDVSDRWALRIGAVFTGPEVTASWVAAVERGDGTAAVLKIGMPHMEADHEIAGLRFWDGDPTVLLLEADERRNAMLLERCSRGTPLRSLPEPEQDVVVATLLRRLWRQPPLGHPFRDLSVMVEYWVDESRANEDRWPDAGLVREGLAVFEELAADKVDEPALLATDLHAGNVLSAVREPWLVIDPKPFVGDRAYDATQHLLNCFDRLLAEPSGTINRFADLLDIDRDRVRIWLFARAAAETHGDWDEDWPALARALSA